MLVNAKEDINKNHSDVRWTRGENQAVEMTTKIDMRPKKDKTSKMMMRPVSIPLGVISEGIAAEPLFESEARDKSPVNPRQSSLL